MCAESLWWRCHRRIISDYLIAAGDEVTGATTFQIEPSLDSGPVYGVVTDTIRPTDTGA